ncbi:MAG: hypothetical protein ACJAQ4_002343 [Cryomorphaceae bacterium]|jgi:hypothetical protein
MPAIGVASMSHEVSCACAENVINRKKSASLVTAPNVKAFELVFLLEIGHNEIPIFALK